MLALSHFLIAAVEFFVLNWLGRHSVSSGYHRISFIQTIEDSPLFDFSFRVLAPTIFLILSAALLYAIDLDAMVRAYWQVTAYYFGIRWAYNLVMGRARLLNWWKQLFIGGIALGLSIVVSEQLLANRSVVLPSARGLSDELWIVVIGFLYITAGRVRWPRLGRTADERRQAYLEGRYAHFARRYGATVSAHAENAFAEVLAYAIMIYESFNRPIVYQAIENYLLFPIGVANTLGPMQVTTSLRLADDQLVRIGVEHVNNGISKALDAVQREMSLSLQAYRPNDSDEDCANKRADDFASLIAALPSYFQDEVVRRAAATYNTRSDYSEEVLGIFSFLRSHYYTRLDQAQDTQSRIGN